MLSEDDIERNRHDQLVRQILNTPGRAIPLKRLFAMTKYPPDVMVLYAEGYSVSNFLVSNSSRGVFLNFVHQGMSGDWNAAVKANYGYNSVEELEKAWVESLYHSRQQPSTQLASRAAPTPDANPSERIVMRQTAPPAPPLLEAPRPIVRGQAPDAEPYTPAPKAKEAQWWLPPAGTSAVVPAAAATAGWQPAPVPPSAVRLGAPRVDATPPLPRLGQPVTGNASWPGS